MTEPPARPDWEHDQHVDAGEVGCGELIMFLRSEIQPFPEGTRILLTAKDYAAATEVDAWCRMTGNLLEGIQDNFFLIVRQRLED